MINLDDLNNGKPVDEKKKQPEVLQPQQSGEDLGIVLSKSSPEAKSSRPVASRSMKELYQEMQKLVYLIDVSSSMNEQVAGTEHVDDFLWSPQVMKTIEELIAVSASEVAAYNPLDPDATAPSDSVMRWAVMADLSTEERKVAVLQNGFHQALGLPINWARWGATNTRSKIELVKGLMQRMVSERRAKYPEAMIEVIQFNGNAGHVTRSQDTTAIVDKIQQMQASGGTHIMNAIELAFQYCQAAPSPVRLHHFVLVSDGEDWSVMDMPGKIPEFKAAGIVLDFIYIAQPGADKNLQPEIQAIKKTCEALGGEFIVVTDAKDFTSKFIEASTRALLPPPPA